MFLTNEKGCGLDMPGSGVVREGYRDLHLRDKQCLRSEYYRADAGQGYAKFGDNRFGLPGPEGRDFADRRKVGRSGTGRCLFTGLTHGPADQDRFQWPTALVG